MAFLRESNANQPFLRAPAVVWWLLAMLVGAHLLRLFAFRNESDANFVVTYGFVPARYSHLYLVSHGMNPGTLLDRALPFITYMFLHGGWTHLLVNSVWLLAFGPIVARRFGWLLFVLFFLVCGVVAAAVQLACNWGSAAPVIGASGAISGLMAAGFRMLPFAPQPGRPPLASILSARMLLWTGLWVFVSVVAGVTGLGTGGEVQLVAWQAHLGGYAAGLLLAGPFDALAKPKMYSAPGA